jgi:hypothetical protein
MYSLRWSGGEAADHRLADANRTLLPGERRPGKWAVLGPSRKAHLPFRPQGRTTSCRTKEWGCLLAWSGRWPCGVRKPGFACKSASSPPRVRIYAPHASATAIPTLAYASAGHLEVRRRPGCEPERYPHRRPRRPSRGRHRRPDAGMTLPSSPRPRETRPTPSTTRTSTSRASAFPRQTSSTEPTARTASRPSLGSTCSSSTTRAEHHVRFVFTAEPVEAWTIPERFAGATLAARAQRVQLMGASIYKQ